MIVPRPSAAAFAVAAALSLPTLAAAQASSPAATSGGAMSQPSGGSSARADQDFVMKAGAGGAAEVAAGQMAQQKATRDEVKQLGQHLVDDHTKANDELKQIAGAKGMTPPAAPTPKQQRDAAKLEKMSGGAFDKAYLNQMTADHKETIALFRKEASSGKDPELKAFASKTLPTLQEHLKMVQSLQTKGGARNMAANEGMGAASAPR